MTSYLATLLSTPSQSTLGITLVTLTLVSPILATPYLVTPILVSLTLVTPTQPHLSLGLPTIDSPNKGHLTYYYKRI